MPQRLYPLPITADRTKTSVAIMGKFSDLFKKESSKNGAVKMDTPPEAHPEAFLPTLRPGERFFRHVPLGSGGTYHLNKDKPKALEGVRYIGTTVCLNSVGVFFEISDTKCFCAHINAFVNSSKATTAPANADNGGVAASSILRKHYATDFMTAKALREQVVSRLNSAAKAGGWGPKTARMCDTLTMTCAKMYGQEPQAAEVVAKAVREWMGAGAAEEGKEKRVARSGAAMVAGWPGIEVKVFDQAPDEGWMAVDGGVGEGDWSFGVEDKECVGSEEGW